MDFLFWTFEELEPHLKGKDKLDLSAKKISSELIARISLCQDISTLTVRHAFDPSLLSKFPYLHVLDLTATALDQFPPALRSLKSLQKLFLNKNPISSVPEWLSEFPLLKFLSLVETQVSLPSFKKIAAEMQFEELILDAGGFYRSFGHFLIKLNREGALFPASLLELLRHETFQQIFILEGISSQSEAFKVLKTVEVTAPVLALNFTTVAHQKNGSEFPFLLSLPAAKDQKSVEFLITTLMTKAFAHIPEKTAVHLLANSKTIRGMGSELRGLYPAHIITIYEVGSEKDEVAKEQIEKVGEPADEKGAPPSSMAADSKKISEAAETAVNPARSPQLILPLDREPPGLTKTGPKPVSGLEEPFLGEEAGYQQRAQLRGHITGLNDLLLQPEPLPSPRPMISALMAEPLIVGINGELYDLPLEELLRSFAQAGFSIFICNLVEALGQEWMDATAFGRALQIKVPPATQLQIMLRNESGELPFQKILQDSIAKHFLLKMVPITYFLKPRAKTCSGFSQLLELKLDWCYIKINENIYYINIALINEKLKKLSMSGFISFIYKKWFNNDSGSLLKKFDNYNPEHNSFVAQGKNSGQRFELFPSRLPDPLFPHPVLDLKNWFTGETLEIEGTTQLLFDCHWHLIRSPKPPLSPRLFVIWAAVTDDFQVLPPVKPTPEQRVVFSDREICEQMAARMRPDPDWNFAFLFNVLLAIPQEHVPAVLHHFSSISPNSPTLLAVRNALLASGGNLELVWQLCSMIAISSLCQQAEKRPAIRIAQHQEGFAVRWHRLQLPLNAHQTMSHLIAHFPVGLEGTHPVAQLLSLCPVVRLPKDSPLFMRQKELGINLLGLLPLCRQGCRHAETSLRHYFQNWVLELLRLTDGKETIAIQTEILEAETALAKRIELGRTVAESLGFKFDATPNDLNYIQTFIQTFAPTLHRMACDMWEQLTEEQKRQQEAPLIENLKSRAPQLVMQMLARGAFSPQSEILLVELVQAGLAVEELDALDKIPLLGQLDEAIQKLCALYTARRDLAGAPILMKFLAKKGNRSHKKLIYENWPEAAKEALFAEFAIEEALQNDNRESRAAGLTGLLAELQAGPLGPEHPRLVALCLEKVEESSVEQVGQICDQFCRHNNGPTLELLNGLVASPLATLFDRAAAITTKYEPRKEFSGSYEKIGLRIPVAQLIPFLNRNHSALSSPYLGERLGFYLDTVQQPDWPQLNPLLPLLAPEHQERCYDKAIDAFLAVFDDLSLPEAVVELVATIKRQIREKHGLPEGEDNQGVKFQLIPNFSEPAIFEELTPFSLITLYITSLGHLLDGRPVQAQRELKAKMATFSEALKSRFPNCSLNFKVTKGRKFALGKLLVEKLLKRTPKNDLAQEMLLTIAGHPIEWMMHSHKENATEWMGLLAAYKVHPFLNQDSNVDFLFIQDHFFKSLLGAQPKTLASFLALIFETRVTYPISIRRDREKLQFLDDLLERAYAAPVLNRSNRLIWAHDRALKELTGDRPLFEKWYNRFLDRFLAKKDPDLLALMVRHLDEISESRVRETLLSIHRKRWLEVTAEPITPEIFQELSTYLLTIARHYNISKAASEFIDRSRALFKVASDWNQRQLDQVLQRPGKFLHVYFTIIRFLLAEFNEPKIMHQMCKQALSRFVALNHAALINQQTFINFWSDAGPRFHKQNDLATFYSLTMELGLRVRSSHPSFPIPFYHLIEGCLLIVSKEGLPPIDLTARAPFLLQFIPLVCDGNNPQARAKMVKKWTEPFLTEIFGGDLENIAKARKLLGVLEKPAEAEQQQAEAREDTI